jgi:hypothetical protein
MMTDTKDADADLHLRRMQTLLDLEKGAFKAVTLANGSAIIALLAFLGNVWSKAAPDRVPVSVSLRVAMILFAFGVFTAVAGTVAGYMSVLSWPRNKPFQFMTFSSLLVGALAFIAGAIFAVFGLT